VMLKLAFGDEPTSARQSDLLRKLHTRIKGTTPDGAPYDAMDPELLVWVWATLVDVSVRMYQRGVRPLSIDERERYYQEQKHVAYACGVPVGRCPDTYADFVAYLDAVTRNALHVNPTAELVASAGRRPPLPRPLDRVAGALVTLFTAGLLPEEFRDALGFRWSAGRERALDALFFVSRLVARVTPRALRHAPNRYLIKRKTPLGWWSGRSLTRPSPARH
jgi:uncharacterized protein (DUF2236 family)